jgi:hypothetical protein
LLAGLLVLLRQPACLAGWLNGAAAASTGESMLVAVHCLHPQASFAAAITHTGP